MKTQIVRVASKLVEAEDTAVYELISSNDAPLPAFSPGAHVDVMLPDGFIRQYSLCNPPWERHRYVLGVLRAPDSRGGSQRMHELQVGSEVAISEPRNLFPLVEAAPALLLAGGIGITPLICMAEALSEAATPFELHYCTRSAARTAFRQRIERARFADQVYMHFDDGPAEQRLDLSTILSRTDAHAHLYVCGPAGFIDFVVSTAKAAGWPPSRLHVEFFAPPAVTDAGRSAPAGEFVVELAKSGKRLTIPSDRSITDVLLDNGVDIALSCEQGVCGTCLTRVLAGTPDHRDVFLTDAERERNDQMTPCCSRARSDVLVLDL